MRVRGYRQGQMTEALRVLATIALLGALGAPLTRMLLGRLPGAGLGLAPTVGLLLVAWLAWLLVSLDLLSWGTGAAALAAGLVALAAGLVALAGRRARRGGSRRSRGRPRPEAEPPPPDPLRRPLALAAGALLVVAFAGMALLVAYSPDVWNTEKPMDMALVNAVNAGTELPPRDPWLAGEELNYYYLGHLAIALVVEVTGVEPTRGYNLGLALVFALTAAGAFSLGAGLWAAARPGGRARAAGAAGLLAAALTAVLGSLDGARELLAGGGPLREYDWFAPSRVIPGTINEFPAFSFTLGDLHAHVLAVPATLLLAGVAVGIVLGGPRWRDLPLTAVALGSLYAINAWSAPVGAGLLGLALLARGRGAAWGIALLAASALAVLPFLLAYEAPTGGIGLVEERRELALFLRDHLLIYGPLLGLALAGLASHVAGAPRPGRTLAWAGVALLVGGVLLAPADLAGALGLAALTLVALHALLHPELAPARRAGFLLLAAGLGLLLVPELVYVRDEFDGSELQRMNTVFKFGYQAWILLALGGVVALGAALPRAVRVPGALALAALLVAAAVYPVAGTYARKAGFSRAPTLDGLGWLRASAPGDVAAIAWLRAHAPRDAVVLETVGQDYSALGHARISTFTGLPTVLGWAGHERQWGHEVGTRRADVDALYRTPDPAAARVLLDRYAVTHVVLGPLEASDHGDAGVAKWPALARRVFAREGTEVYEVESNSDPAPRRR